MGYDSRTNSMADLMLPVIDASVSALEAMDLMRSHSLSGVIGHKDKNFRLYTASQVVSRLADDRSARLADVESTELHSQRKRSRTMRSLGLRLDSPGIAAVKAALAGSSRSPRSAWFSVAASLIPLLEATPRDCYCRVDGKSVAGGTNGGDCPFGHHGTVRCI
jgi:hypothetical protein